MKYTTLIALILVVLFGGFVQSNRVHADTGFNPLQDAMRISGYKYAGTPVAVAAVSPDDLWDTYCKKACKIHPKALQHGTDILVSTELDFDKVLDQSILVHEMVHVLQEYNKGGRAASCADWVARESEAYALQNKYLLSKGAQLVRAPIVGCF